MKLSAWRQTVSGGASALLWCLAAPVFAATHAAVRPPPHYYTFEPPLFGQSYRDQAFGTSIKRVSDAYHMRHGPAFISTEFPTATPFNCTSTLLLLQHQSVFALYDGQGSYLRALPFAVNASSEPRWSRSEPNVLYYVSANDLMKLDVASGVSSLVRSFAEYAAIRGRGESDISRDGDHFVFAADERAGLADPGHPNRYVFVYEVSTDTQGPVLDTLGHDFDNLYIAPDNSVAIGWLPTGAGRFTGVELFDRGMKFQRQLTHAIGHMHLTRDTNGEDVLVWTNSNDPLPIANCRNGIVKVRLSDAQQSCLLRLDWSLAVHITAPDGNGWAFVETYAPADPPPQLPDWVPYTNEILRVRLDGSETRRLLHHRSRPFNNYGYQPRATLSRDGTRLVFTSNFGLQQILGYPLEYADVYLVYLEPGPGADRQPRRLQQESPGPLLDGLGSARHGEGVDPDP